jgi:hypothetical protein
VGASSPWPLADIMKKKKKKCLKYEKSFMLDMCFVLKHPTTNRSNNALGKVPSIQLH